MVAVIENLVIMVANLVAAPIGIFLVKIFPVCWMGGIPRVPFGPIPGSRPYHIDARIDVIWGPAIFRAEIVMQNSLREPIAVVKDPRRIRPNPR
jgi:hypothetical protein